VGTLIVGNHDSSLASHLVRLGVLLHLLNGSIGLVLGLSL
jgi:hypothetical protein